MDGCPPTGPPPSVDYAIVHNPQEINKSITYDILNSSDRREVIRMMRKRGFKI